ncbi:MAG: T9SS type A sorting domain-containing protein, partial [Bacteroidota bacterium]
ITEPDAITIVSDTAINATSESATDGSIEVEATGGTGVLTYTLTPGDISNETGIFNNLAHNDYTVSVTDENSCGPVTTDLTVSFPDAIESISLSKNIKLYPNPTSSKLTLEINIDRSDSYTIEIISLSGQQLYKENTQSDRSFTKELDLSGYAKGIYFIKVSTDHNHYQERIILQ